MSSSSSPSESRNELIARRYGRSPTDVDAGAPMSEALATMLRRRSVRAFLDTPITSQEVQSIVAAAQSAASSSNLQAWSIIAVQDPERKRRVAQLAGAQRHIERAPLLLVFLADLARLRRLGDHLKSTVDGLDYFETFLVAVIDATLAAQNASVAAESLGLGTCYIGALRNHPEALAEWLGLPAEAFAVFGLAIGHEDPARQSAVKPRLPPEVVLHHERYVPFDTGALTPYDEVIRTFQGEQGMQVTDWSRKSADRVAGPQSLSGRERLLESIKRLGFPLR